MLRPVINCVKCEGLMEEGFILDHGESDRRNVTTWVEGRPVKSFWSGIKIKQKQQFLVKTFRCANCGFLESYAVEEKPDSIFS